jgi:hypothetical protein
MTTASNKLDKTTPTGKTKSFISRTRLLGLLALSVAFASGYLFANAMGPWSATKALVQKYPTQLHANIPTISNSASRNALPIQATLRSGVTAHSDSQATMRLASTPTDTKNNQIASVPDLNNSAPVPYPSVVQPGNLSSSASPVPYSPSFDYAQNATSATANASSHAFAPVYSGVGNMAVQSVAYQSPEEEAANKEIAELTMKLQQAKNNEKSDLVAKLKTEVGEMFKLRHASQAKEIEEMEKQLVDAKALHAKRQEKEDEIIERRLRNLMNEVDDLDWDRSLKSALGYPAYGVNLVPSAY